LRIKLNPLNIKPRNSWWKILKRFMFCTDSCMCFKGFWPVHNTPETNGIWQILSIQTFLW
jgi:hypothetical protein